VIDRAVLDLLDIDADTPLSITTDGKCLIISPVHDPEKKKALQEAMKEGNRRYGRMLKQLAE
jgi:hypothetical protein